MSDGGARDRWARWVLETASGGDPKEKQNTLDYLAPVRERVLDHAALNEGATVLDVGAGDGLIALGALKRVGRSGTVIFGDISHDLLVHSSGLADVDARCLFVGLSADRLPVRDGSIDAITTRSVLVYLFAPAKRRALREFHRVLRRGGRISLFEPINSFGQPEPEYMWHGFDVTPVKDLAARVRSCGRPGEGPRSHPLLDFDERDLVAWAEEAGFDDVHLDYLVEIGRDDPWPRHWDTFIKSSGNPLDPTLEEAMDEVFSPAERERFVAHVRPLFERGDRSRRSAVAYLWARRPRTGPDFRAEHPQ